MRLLFVHNLSHRHARAGGGQRITHEVAAQAVADGHRVWVPLLLEADEEAPDVPYDVVAVRAHRRLVVNAVRMARAVRRAVLDHGIEAVHASAPEAGLVPGRLPGSVGLVATTQHPDPPPLPPTDWRRPVASLRHLRRYQGFHLEARLLRRAHEVSVPSTWSRTMIRDRGYVAGTRPVTVIPNGVSDLWFAAPGTPDAAASDLVLVGRLDHQKGIDTLVDALALPALAGVTASVVGGGPDEAALRRRADAAGVGGRIRFAGVLDHRGVRDLVAAGRVFVLPTRSESFGMAILEAMAAGRPVVTTPVGGVPDFAQDGVNALIVRPDDPSALAAAVRRLLDDGELAGRLAVAARTTADDYRWPAITTRYVALMDRARAGTPPASP